MLVSFPPDVETFLSTSPKVIHHHDDVGTFPGPIIVSPSGGPWTGNASAVQPRRGNIPSFAECFPVGLTELVAAQLSSIHHHDDGETSPVLQNAFLPVPSAGTCTGNASGAQPRRRNIPSFKECFPVGLIEQKDS